MNNYIPSFKCPYCLEDKHATLSSEGSSGYFVVCDCKESRDAKEREHRAIMEARKRHRGKRTA